MFKRTPYFFTLIFVWLTMAISTPTAVNEGEDHAPKRHRVKARPRRLKRRRRRVYKIKQEAVSQRILRTIRYDPMKFFLTIALGGTLGGILGSSQGGDMFYSVLGVMGGVLISAVIGVFLMLKPKKKHKMFRRIYVRKVPEPTEPEAEDEEPPIPTPKPTEETEVEKKQEEIKEHKGIPAGYMATIFDLILLLLLLFFGYRGLRKGLFSQLFSTITTIAFIMSSKHIFGVMRRVAQNLWPGLDEAALPFATFTLMICVGFAVMYIAEKIFKRVLEQTFVGYLDSVLGGVLGVIQASFALSAMIVLLDIYGVSLPEVYTQHMSIYNMVAKIIPSVVEFIKSYLPNYTSFFTAEFFAAKKQAVTETT